MAQNQLLYSGKIAKVKFSLNGGDDIKRNSHVLVKSHDLFRNNVPYPNGVYDAHLGTTDHAYPCQTCFNSKRACLGHSGHIALNYPLWSAMSTTDGRKWLKLICFTCGKPIIAESDYMRFPRNKRLDEASKIARSANKKCVHCKTVHPILKKDAIEPLAIVAEIYEDKRQTEKWIIYPHNAMEILSRVSDETMIKMGKSISSHANKFVVQNIEVPSVIIRPDVQKMGGGRSKNDDLTTILQIIIKKNDMMPSVIPAVIDAKMHKAIFELNNAYFEFVKAGGDSAINSIAMRLKGKTGRFRKNQMGKRVRNMVRSTITGDCRLKIDEVGMPLVFARTMQYDEVVQEYNKKQLLLYIQNGRKVYPGATGVIKKSSGKLYDVDSGEIELENGDIVLRDMITGDPVNFNRQPSLTVSSIGCHKAVVCEDPRVLTLRMNVISCALYSADFN